MCGKTLITKQSGDSGFPCNCVYIVEKIHINKEIYMSLTLEDVAKENPEKIFKMHVDTSEGLDIDKLLQAAEQLELNDYKT